MTPQRIFTSLHLAHSLVLAGIVFILTLAISSPATYAGTTWDGGGVSGNWSEANNWNANILPGSGATLTFAGDLQTITNNDYFAAGTTVNAFNFTNDGTSGQAGSFTLSGNAVTNTGADIVTTAIAVGGINLTDTISLDIALNNNKNFVLGAGHDLVISGTLSGSRNITKNGAGTLTLSAGNTYTGSTTINAGTLSIATITNGGVAGALGNSTSGAGNLVLGGGTLQYTGSNGSTDRNFTLTAGTTSVIDVSSAGTTLTISGGGAATSGGLTKNGSGTLLFTASNSYTGDTTVNSGILQIGSNNRISDSSTLRVNGGTFDKVTFNDTVAGVVLSANGTITGTSGALTSASNFILENGTASAILGGTVGVNKTTSGIVILSAANTYTGTTTISAGTLQIGSGGTTGALSTSSAITNDGTLTFNRSNTLTQGTDFSSVISGTGSVTQAGTGILTLSGNNTYTGVTTISSGTIRLGNAVSNNSTISGDILINGGTLNYATAVDDQISNSATVTLSSGSFALAARDETIGTIAMSGGDLSMTSGVLTLSSPAGFTGGTISMTVAGGSIITAGQTTLGNATFSYSNASNASKGLILSSGLSVNANTTANFNNASTGVGRISLEGSTQVFDVGASANMNIGWALASTNSSGALTKNGTGTVTLSAANTYTGTTTVNAGTLSLGNVNALQTTTLDTGTSGSQAVTFSVAGANTYNIGAIQGDDTLDFGNNTISVGANNAATSFTGTLAGSGGNLTKVGSGALTLSGNNSYTGSTTISAGTIRLGNAVSNNSTILGDILINGGTLNYATAISDQISNSATVTLSSGSFVLAGRDETIGSIAMSGGALSMTSGILTLSSPAGFTGGTISMTAAGGSIIAAGQTTLGNATFSYSNASNASKGLILLSGLAVDADTTANFTNASTGVGRISLEGSTQVFDVGASANLNIGWALASTTSSGGLTKNGTGTLTLSAANTYNGTTTVNAGTVSLGNVNALQNTTLDTGTSGSQAVAFSVPGSTTYNIGAIQGGDTLDFGSNTISVGANNATTSFTGSLAGSGGSLTKVGSSTLTLSGSGSSYSETTTISAGTIQIDHANALGSGGNITFGGGGLKYGTGITQDLSSRIKNSNSAILVDTSAESITWGTALDSTNSGGLTKNGTGTLTLSATNTYGGATTINAGTLAVSGDIANSGLVLNSSGIISPGTTAAADSFGTSSITINGGGYNWTLSSANGSAGTGWDQITSTGALTSSGLMTVHAYGTPGDWDNAANYSWDIISANSVSGFSPGNFSMNFTNFGIGLGNRTGTWAFTNPSGGIIQLTYTAATDPVWAGGTGNWDTGFTPAPTDGANIAFSGAGGTATNNISNGTLTTIGDIEFRTGAGAYTLAAEAGTAGASGGTALSVTGSIINNSTATQTLNTDMAFAATRTIAANTGNISIGGAISGSGGLTKNGSNKLTLTAANTYTGATTINTGTLEIGSGSTSGSLDASSAITNNANLVFNRSNDFTVSNTITGTGNLTKSGAGTLTLSGASSSYSGTSTLTAGTIQIGHANGLGTGGNITFSGGGLKYGTGITTDLSARIKNSDSAILVDTNGETVTWGTALVSTNSGGLTKNGTGTLTINSTSAYTGATAINGGKLVINNNTAGTTAWTPGAIAINNAATLEFSGSLTILENADDTITFDSSGGGAILLTNNVAWRNAVITTTGGLTNTITGAGVFNGQNAANNRMVFYTVADGSDGVDLEVSVTHSNVGINKSGSGTLALLNATNNMDLGITINAGTLEIGATGRLQGGSYTQNITNNGALVYSGTSAQTLSGVISGTGALTQNAASTLTLSGNNTYSGATTINAGTIQIGAAGALGAGSYAQNITNNGTLIYSGTNAQTLSGVISGSGALTQNAAGTLTLSGANTYSGGTMLNTGTLVIGNAAAAGSGSITQASGSSLLKIDTTGTVANNMSVYNVLASQSATLSGAITVNNATWDVETGDTLTISGAVSGNGGVTKNGTGTLILSGSNSYASATTVNAGTLTAAHANALGGNTTVQINGGSLLVTADDTINGKNITLASTATGGASAASLAFSGTYNGTAGSLTLNADSIIDLGSGSVVLHFSNMAMGIYNLAIYNWTGTTLWNGGNGNNTDQFYVDRTVSDNELNRISFYSGFSSSSFVGTGFQLSGGSFNQQIIPVPEAETYAAAALLILGYAVHSMRLKRRSGRLHPAKPTA